MKGERGISSLQGQITRRGERALSTQKKSFTFRKEKLNHVPPKHR